MTKTVTLCKRCGNPIPQQAGRGRPRLYCAEGDCAAQAKRQRELRRATPGLEGALARAEELYEQIDQSMTAALAPLAEALRAETDPAQVEARLAEVRSEAAGAVAAARAERNEVTGRSESLAEELAAARIEIERLASSAEEAQVRAKEAVTARVAAVKAAEQTRAEADAQILSAREEVEAATAAREDAEASAQAALGEAKTAREDSDAARNAQAAADEAATAARGEADRARARAEQIATEAEAAVRAGQEALARADARAAALAGERDAERSRVETLLGDLAIARRDAEKAVGEAEAARQALAASADQVSALASDQRVLESKLEAASTDVQGLRGEVESWRRRALAAEVRLERPTEAD
ncbi:hypothetical protein [Glycomyces buryatensis]|uniref:Chromosome segregation ATPase n=1 Tax=Glycomyces buryatensis TaxID=2570927 RepID=A0A4S8Q059_9ACTN|nr:hypothetical protein [Glycomyces buryatensis]THV33454.1 hypothetical protein FAB82_25255 [Glycomyces buryatensis]